MDGPGGVRLAQVHGSGGHRRRRAVLVDVGGARGRRRVDEAVEFLLGLSLPLKINRSLLRVHTCIAPYFFSSPCQHDSILQGVPS